MLLSLIRKNRSLINLQVLRTFANKNATSTETLKEQKWDLFAGVLVERLPIVSKSLNAVEQEFQNLSWQQEFEGSLKSDHEIKHERDIVQAELIRKGEMEIDLDESSSKQTAQDLKDAYVEEYKKFSLGPRITEADKKGDLRSTDRALDEVLYLVIETVVGDKKTYSLPQGKMNDGETLRDTAERILKENCGDKLKVDFLGNAPSIHFKVKYPSSVKKETFGAKIFLYRTNLKSGNVDPKVNENFQWQTKEELGKVLENMSTLKNILF